MGRATGSLRKLATSHWFAPQARYEPLVRSASSLRATGSLRKLAHGSRPGRYEGGTTKSRTGEPAQQRVGAERVGAVPPYPIDDLLVGGDHHDRTPGRLGPDKPADQLVGGLPLPREQHSYPAWRGRHAHHAFGAVEHDGHLRAGLRSETAEA